VAEITAGTDLPGSSPLIVQGTSFLWRKPGESKKHLRLVATNPLTDPILIVPIDTYRSGYPDQVILDNSDHPWLEINSVPAYPHFYLVTHVQLAGHLECPDCTRQQHVFNRSTVKQILETAFTNEKARCHLKPEIKKFLQQKFGRRAG
jgi:hypothetical protein